MDATLALVERAQAGDRAAFADLHARFGRPLFLYLTGLLRLREDAEDAWQAAFLSAWRHLARLRRPERFAPWLFHIARNSAHDVARRRASFPQALGAGEDLLVARPDAQPGDAEAASLVAVLEPRTRALVLLRAVEGWSAEEVGAALSWSVATVRRRYARALDLLRARVVGKECHEG
jgi:RNA polymerase sigma-70 factor (ECF subfamily)